MKHEAIIANLPKRSGFRREGGDPVARLLTLRYTVSALPYEFAPGWFRKWGSDLYGRMLASSDTMEDASVKLWDPNSGKLLRTLKGHEDGINALAFSPDGKMLASGGQDDQVILWDTRTGKKLHVLPDLDTNGTIVLWNAPALLRGDR